MNHKLKSLLVLLVITIDRFTDHAYRYITGLPQAKRSLITPHLFLGGQYSLTAFERLKVLGVTGIVNMRMRSIHKDIDNIHDVRILNLPTPDRSAPSQENLKKGADFIKDEVSKGGKVYIHCRYGEGRGPTMAIAYLISTGLVYQDAYELVKKTRTFISPTRVQVQALLKFENALKSQN